MPLHLGIDAWNLLHDRRGVGRYTRAILQRWAGWDRALLQPCLVIPQRLTWIAARRYQEEAGMPGVRVAHRSAVVSMGLDVMWYPWNGMSWASPAVNVATLHDASVFSLPPAQRAHAEKEQRPFRLAAVKAQRIITDSHFSKLDLVRHLGVDPQKVDVVHLGVDRSFSPTALKPHSLNCVRYVLFVGEPEERKGVDVLFQAADLLPEGLRETTEVVLAGNSGKYALPLLPQRARVRNLGRVSDADLCDLYASAALVVQPSRYEGFGLPVIEAMAAGAPVVASDIPSLREAAGDAAYFVPPGDAIALARAIERVLGDPSLAAELRSRGTAHAALRTWDATAAQTFNSIERAVDEARA